MRLPPTYRVLRVVGVALLVLTIGLWLQSTFFALRINAFARDIFALQVTSTWGYIRFGSIWPTSNIPWTLNLSWGDNGGMEKLQAHGWHYVGELVLRWPAFERILPNSQVPGNQGSTLILVPYWVFVMLAGGLVMISFPMRRAGPQPATTRHRRR